MSDRQRRDAITFLALVFAVMILFTAGALYVGADYYGVELAAPWR